MSPTSKFDTVEHIKDVFGTFWDSISCQMRQHRHVPDFRAKSHEAGLDLDTEAWYDLYFGQGAYEAELRHVFWAEVW